MATVTFHLDLCSAIDDLPAGAAYLHRATSPSAAGGYAVEHRELWAEDGRLVALNQTNGKQAWEFSLGAPVTGPPISFAVGGKQYIAVVTGGGKITGDLLVGDDPKLQYLKSLPVGGTLTVFGLFE